MAALLVAGMTALAVAPARAEEDDTPTQRLAVEMIEYRFSPSTVQLEAGVETHLTIINRGRMIHEFEVPYLTDLQVDVENGDLLVAALGLAEVRVAAGKSVTLVFTPERRGEFPIVCDVKEPAPHKMLGMRGRLVVY